MTRARLVALCVTFLTGLGFVVFAPGNPLPPAPVPTVTFSTGSSACNARGELPDPVCTPGATNPVVTQDSITRTICVRGWTATVRPALAVTQPIKVAVEVAYGIPGPHPHPFGVEELDHLVPLELGGSPASRLNLWPEPAPAYHVKDGVENRLRSEVCSGRIGLAVAQHAIASDWRAAP